MKKKLFRLLLTLGVITSMVTTATPVFAVETNTSTTQSQSAPVEPTDEWAAANGWEYTDYNEYSKTVEDITYKLHYTITYWEDYLERNQLGFGYFTPHWLITVTDGSNASGTVTIPASIDGFPVLTIGRDAFNGNKNITEVVIPEGVQEVAAWTFQYCSNLSKISLPNTLLFIDSHAFTGCNLLTEITIPASVLSIAFNALPSATNDEPLNITFKGNAPEITYATAEYPSLTLSDNTIINVYEGTTGWDTAAWNNLNINVIKPEEPVTIPATGITVNPTSVSIKEGETAAVTATVTPDNATDKTVTWVSADSTIATVDNGTITGVTAGTTTVTATCGNVSASVAVTVTAETEPDPEEPGTDPGEPTPDPEPGVTLPYTDVTPDAWYYDTVADVYEKGLMTGMNPTTFAPAETLARAQFAIILYRMESEPDIAFEATFKDVTDGQWYTDAILWAADASVVTGYSNGNFGPADKINREQMATMMFRYANAKGLDTSQRADFSSYPDAGSVSPFAKDAMSWCVANGIISGDNGRLNPQDETARAVCATIISRFYNAYNL